MQFSITLDANALEKGKYRYWVQYRSVDFTGAGAGDEQYAEFDWAGTPITGAPAVAATLPQSPAVAPGAIAQAPSPVGAPLTAPPEEIAPVPAPIALPDPEPAKVGRAAVEAVKENAAPKTRQEEIEKAWKEAEIDTLNQGVLERDRRILAKMRRASEELLSRGNRLPVRRRVGNENGASVLNLYALLHAEQAIEDPRLKFSSPEMSWAVSDLVQLDTTATYTASLQTSALSMLPKRDVVLEALKRNQRNILSSNGDGSYTYQLNVEAPQASPGSAARARAGGGFTFDHSNTQYGNLGALALLDADMEVSMNYWQTISAHWRQTQCSDGGWDYTNGKNASTGTMTEAGLTALLTASYAEMSHVSPFRDNAIIRGFRAMEKHLDTGNVYASHNGYGLYGIERVGLTSGLKRIGGHEWYNEGIASILPNMDLQRPGFEQRVFDRNNLGSNSSKTAFELLFMTRGRNPVVMNKLQYDGAWDFHPWDLAYLTRWLSRTFERPLIWQVIGNKDPMDDWMDAPILLITGDQAFTVNDQLLTKLRNYVDAGGTILSVATRDSPAFTQFVIKLSNRLSRGTYEMRKMDKDDPFHSLYRKSENPPETWAMSNGVREIWIHSPRDIARDWQRNAVAQAASWDTPVNAYLYVNGKSPMKRRIFLTDPTAQVANGNFKKRVVVGRLNYAGNWNPEPGAWPLIGVWMARYGVQVTVVEVTAANLMRVKPDLLSITGTANFRPTKELGDAIDTYVAAGGTILADAAGGRSEFTESFTQLMRNSLEPIPMNDPLYDLRAEGVALRDNIEYRRSWILKNGQSAQARLRGAKSGADRYSIIFSPDDLTSGFLGTNTWGVLGYSPDTSRQIVRAVLEYATSK
jgi:hypothetical protein